jgi:hypothetical protein
LPPFLPYNPGTHQALIFATVMPNIRFCNVSFIKMIYLNNFAHIDKITLWRHVSRQTPP